MSTRRTECLATFLALMLGLTLTAHADIPLIDFEAALAAVPVSDVGRAIAAIEVGTGQQDFPSFEMMQYLQRLATTAYSESERESLLVDVFAALEEGLPIDGLITKGLEGLARGVPAVSIHQSLHQRRILLAETRDLLYAKGIFSVAPGSPQSVDTALPTPRFNLLVTHISDTIADSLEGGGSPFEGQMLLQEVRFRLTSLSGAILNPADVELVLKRLEPADLTRVALSAVS